jgi:3',5'-cyclic AMP phosphodiesterase CpdA
MEETKIVHLSDLHLGNDFVLRSTLGLRRFWRTEDPKLIDALTDALRELQPHYVVVSGDIVNKSTKRTFRHAASTLQRIFQRAGIDVSRTVLVVPGNHDVPIRRRQHEYFGRLERFVTFLRDLFEESNLLTRKAQFVRVDVQRRLCFVGLDSTLKVGAASTQRWLFQWQVAEGELGKGQRDWLAQKVAKVAQLHPGFDRFVKIVIIHHHPEGIEGTAPSERFMQLLDAVDAKAVFKNIGVNVILHGHKHVPHQRRVTFDEKSHCTVVGAGTALCAIRGEDAGEGNSFNLVRILPASNIIEVQRYKANQERQFVKSDNATKQPIFPGSASGYRIRTMEAHTKILDMNGTCVDSTRRLGVFVDGPRDALPKTAFKWASGSAVSEIVGFDFDKESIGSIEYHDGHDENDKRVRQGAFILKKPLEWGGKAVDLWWTLEAKNAFCMSRSDIPTYYPGQNQQQEGIGADMVHPADVLHLTVEFPQKFWPKVVAKCVDPDHIEIELPADVLLQSDRLAGRHTLVVRNPLFRHEYGLWWDIP